MVDVVTSGSGSDPDGFRLALDGAGAAQVTPSSSTVFLGVSPGQHEIALRGLAPNCLLQGDDIRSTIVSSGDTSAIAFEVICDQAAGEIQITTASSGTDIDPSGYTVLLDGVPRLAIEPTGSVTLATTAATHEIALGAMTPNCRTVGIPARQVGVSAGGSVRVDFEVACEPAPPLGHGREVLFLRERPAPGSERPELHSMNDDGTNVRPLLPDFLIAQMTPDWAPDGERLLFAAGGSGENIELYILTYGNSSPAQLVLPGLVDKVEPRWSPDGARIVFTHEDPSLTDHYVVSEIWMVGADGSDPERVPADVEGLPTSPAWSPDGSQLALMSTALVSDEFGDCCFPGPSSIYIVDADGSNPRLLVPPADSVAHPALSPDGSKIVYSSFGDLYLTSTQGGSAIPLTTGPGVDDHPAWSPDGSRIAFSSDRDGNSEIYVVDITGGKLTRLTNDPAIDTEPAWRP